MSAHYHQYKTYVFELSSHVIAYQMFGAIYWTVWKKCRDMINGNIEFLLDLNAISQENPWQSFLTKGGKILIWQIPNNLIKNNISIWKMPF